MKKIIPILFISLILFSCNKSNTKIDVKELSNILKQYNKSGYFSGVALITKGEEVNLELVSGLKNNAEDEIFSDSQFFIASVTKQFTAAATLKAFYDSFLLHHSDKEQAVKEVILALNNPLSLYLNVSHPVWNGSMPSWANQVTIHHLLSNTSGIINYTELEDYEKDVNGLIFNEQPHLPHEIIDIIKNEELLFAPGTNYDYSNTNFFLLSLVIESISSISYDKYLEEKFFNFLDMKNTKNPVEGNLAKIKNRSEYRELVDQFQYNPFDSEAKYIRDKRYTNVTNIQGANSMISTAKDLYKWNQALHKNFTVIPKELHALMIKNYAQEFNNNFYGYGIIPTVTNIGTIYTHTGGIDGFQSIVRYYNDDDVSLVILNNVGPDLNAFMSKISDMENNLKTKVANPFTRRIIAETKIKAQFPDKRNFINLLEEIDDKTIHVISK